ncbi:MAG: hypothetical protein IBJ14_05250 [Hydrogenophaga sp.]|nr:hypothetical protein [Hydrogenophaga sp.]
MKYLGLGHYNRHAVQALGPDRLAAVMRQCEPHMAAIGAMPQLEMHAGLAERTRQILRTGKQIKVIDGPFAESKELVGAVLLIEADSFDEAVRIASLHPTTQVPDGEALGWRMEVHPVHFLNGASLATEEAAAAGRA